MYATMPKIDAELSPPKLRRARGKRSQEEAAAIIGISREYLSMIENGQSLPNVNIVARLCLLYGVEIRDLLRKAV